MTLLLASMAARASVSILMEEPYGGMGLMNPTGHSAVYLDHVCADSPTVLRACREGELGVVISRYDGIGHYDWLAVPVIPYLYAVESPDEIPLTMDRALEASLRDAYRRTHLETVAPDRPDGSTPEGNWYELIGSAYDRTIYMFQVNSTSEQDASLMALFNDRKNVERYNGAFRNCADFARVTINRFYPHAIRRNFVADFGLTTPKSVARALTHYAKKHPQIGLKIYKIPQIKGDLPRSRRIQGVAESLVKKYGIPLVLLSPAAATVVLTAYIQHGRFSLPKDPPILDFRPAPSSVVAGAPSATESRPSLTADSVQTGSTPAEGADGDKKPPADLNQTGTDDKRTAPPADPPDIPGAGTMTAPLTTPAGILPPANRNLQ